VPVVGNPQFRVLAAGGRTACGATVTGELLCWGNGADGELGNGQFDVAATTPTPVGGGLQYWDVAIGANAAGQATVCARTFTAVYCWGKNSDGEIGDGTRQRKSLPTAVVGMSPNVQIAPGGSHNCARLPSAVVLCWGKGGRLGNGTAQASLTPVAVAGGLVFAAIWSGGTTPAAARTTSRAGGTAGATTREASWATEPQRSGWLRPVCCSRNLTQACYLGCS
jgi:alpha-tubulin suppressor-like RCC1 family protein